MTSNRKDFLKNALMAIAVSLLPKILQPVQLEFPEPDMKGVTVRAKIYAYNEESGFYQMDESDFNIVVSVEHYELLESYTNGGKI